MLESVELWDVGPAGHLRLDLAPRLNVLTGDNGLGKTFILDVAWWILTHSWAGQRVLGRQGAESRPRIEYRIQGRGQLDARFAFATQRWDRETPSLLEYARELVIYARIDGGFSVWDFTRNPVSERYLTGLTDWYRTNTFHFDTHSLWNGLPEDDGRVLCNGLIRDWTTWQFQRPETFSLLAEALAGLSPGPDEIIRPGKPARLYIDDAREFPTISLPYGTIPVTLASAGMRRILALAYLLVWSWTEHVAASELRRQEPTDQIVLLFDEVEAHLHPQWQRVLLPAVLRVVEKLRPDIHVQVIATTHAPLVLASLETTFDEQWDRVFTFELHDGEVAVAAIPWAKQGDATNWLVSEVFGLRQARSREAERAIEAAKSFMRGDVSALPDDLRTLEAIDRELRRVLAGHDPFWPRWIVKREAVA